MIHECDACGTTSEEEETEAAAPQSPPSPAAPPAAAPQPHITSEMLVYFNPDYGVLSDGVTNKISHIDDQSGNDNHLNQNTTGSQVVY